MRKTFLPLIIAVFLSSSIYGETGAAASIVEARNLYLNNRVREAVQTLDSIEGELSPFLQAKKLYVEGLIAIRKGDKDTAEERFAAMDRIATDVVVLSRPADGYALSAEARSRLMLIRGIAYIIRNSSRTEKLARAALQEDPEHAFALLVLARGKINAPGLFGGDVDFGIESIETVLSSFSIEKADRFAGLYGLARAWRKKKEYDKALYYVEAALAIYPGNPEAANLRNQIAKKTQE